MTEIRSYRRVFDLERRIYRIDRIRLNPGGVPVRGAVYFLAIVALLVLAARLPLLEIVLRALPWYLRDVLLPAFGSALLALIRIEGRPFHLAALAVTRFGLGPRRLAGLRATDVRSCTVAGARWHPQPILMLPDGSDGRMRRFRYRGPGAVRVSVAHERQLSGRWPPRLLAGGPQLRMRELPRGAGPGKDQVIVLDRAARVRVG